MAPQPNANYLLSRLGIRCDGRDGQMGSPKEIAGDLISYVGLLEVSGDEKTYHTPDYKSSPVGPDAFSPAAVKLEREAFQNYQIALRNGDPNLVHAAVDHFNEIRSKKGDGEFIPPSDIEIIQHREDREAVNFRFFTALREDSESEPFFLSDDGRSYISEYQNELKGNEPSISTFAFGAQTFTQL